MLEYIPPKFPKPDVDDEQLIAVCHRLVRWGDATIAGSAMTPEFKAAFWNYLQDYDRTYCEWVRWHEGKEVVEARIWPKYLKGKKR